MAVNGPLSKPVLCQNLWHILTLLYVHQDKEERWKAEAKRTTILASQSLLKQLSESSKFDTKELQKLLKVGVSLRGCAHRGLTQPFLQAFAHRCDERGALARGDFTDVMLDHYPMLRRTAGVSFLFDFFDVNHNNSVDFKEFALGMSRLTRGTLHVRALDLASGVWRGIS